MLAVLRFIGRVAWQDSGKLGKVIAVVFVVVPNFLASPAINWIAEKSGLSWLGEFTLPLSWSIGIALAAVAIILILALARRGYRHERTKEMAAQIDILFKECVELRNKANSLRVLNKVTEDEMNILQQRLIKTMRDIAPFRAITLETLNHYDRSKHPPTNLQDPRRTLEFSELLLRVQKFLEKSEE